MTKANAKVLYTHFVAKGMKKEMKNILKHNPEFAQKEKVIETKPDLSVKPIAQKPKEVKTNGKKSKR